MYYKKLASRPAYLLLMNACILAIVYGCGILNLHPVLGYGNWVAGWGPDGGTKCQVNGMHCREAALSWSGEKIGGWKSHKIQQILCVCGRCTVGVIDV